MPHHPRADRGDVLLDIKPFVLRQREELVASGVLEFIETLELATPKH